MKRVLLIALATVLTLGAATQNTAAQTFELGARAGIGSHNLDVKGLALLQSRKARLGWNLAVVSRIRLAGFGDGLLGAGLFFQPEVVFSQNSTVGDDEFEQLTRASSDYSGRLRMHTVDIPLLLSLKVSLVRVQAGPVFNLMSNYATKGGKLDLSPLRSATGYALGASVDLGGLVIDGRYHGEFKKLYYKESQFHDLKGSLSSWSLGVGLMF
jgi:hypothetical protein